MIVYSIKHGEFILNGIKFGEGYSGYEECKNDPASCHIIQRGPIPCGLWTIEGPPFNSAEHGPYCLRLEPDKDTVTFGRSGFLIHGDSLEHPGTASLGCICANRIVRTRLYQCGDRRLRVVSGLPAPDVDGEISV